MSLTENKKFFTMTISIKKRKIIIISLVFFLFIGLLIPGLFSVIYNKINVDVLCKDQARLLLPKMFKFITIYHQYSIEDDNRVVVRAHTLFNITLQKITFQNMEYCNLGSTNDIKYIFSK